MTTESIETKQYDDPAKIEPMQRESLGQVTGLCFIDTQRDKVTPIKLLDVWMGHRRMEEDQGREEGGGNRFLARGAREDVPTHPRMACDVERQAGHTSRHDVRRAEDTARNDKRS